MKARKTPTTLKELLEVSKRPLWAGKAYCTTAITNVEHFINAVGDLELTAIRTTTLDDFVDDMQAKGLSDSTINRKLTNVHSMLKYAVDREWMVKMPKFSWKREENQRVRWVSEKEEDQMFALLDQWGETEVKRFLTVLMDTGMRRGELLKLEAKDIQGDWVRLWVTKTKQARSVPLSERAKGALGDKPFDLTIGQLRIVWAKLKKEMGLEADDDFVLHTLRHTAATRTLAKTGNIAIVQKLLGHRNIQTTMRYAHLSDEELLAAVK
jgi:integrase